MAVISPVGMTGTTANGMQSLNFDTASVALSSTSDTIKFRVAYRAAYIDEVTMVFASDDITVKIFSDSALANKFKVFERQYTNASAPSALAVGFTDINAGYQSDGNLNKFLYMTITNSDAANATGVMSIKVISKQVV